MTAMVEQMNNYEGTEYIGRFRILLGRVSIFEYYYKIQLILISESHHKIKVKWLNRMLLCISQNRQKFLKYSYWFA